MDVSVLVPAYNAGKTINSCLNSILENNTAKIDYELIVIDDGSTDNTSELVQELMKNHDNILYISKENAGKASALNKGLEIAKGEFILVTDSDTVVEKDWIQKIHDNLSKYDMVQGSCLGVSTESFLEKIQYVHSLAKLKYSTPKTLFGSGANNGFKKNMADDVGGFNETTVNVTTDFISRIIQAGYTLSYDPDIAVFTNYSNKFSEFISQKLRWRESTKNESRKANPLIRAIQLFYNQGISFMLLSCLFALIITKNPVFLISIPLVLIIDTILYLNPLLKMMASKDRKWILYFPLYSLVLTFTVRLLLIPYLLFRVFVPRRGASFKK